MTASVLLPTHLGAPVLLGGGRGTASTSRPPAGTVAVPGAGFDLPVLGPCRHQPRLLILLFDNSPSVAGGYDEPGTRFREATIALDYLRRRCQCRRELVALRTFDLRTPCDAGPVHLDRDGWASITSALALAPEVEAGSSRLRRALLSAERLAHGHPHHGTTLVVFSDFELADTFPGGVLDRLSRFPGDVHAVVLTAEPPTRLLASRVAVRRITAESRPGDVARTVVAALSGPPASVTLVDGAGTRHPIGEEPR